MPTARAYAAPGATSPLAYSSIPRREPTDRDVEIEILFRGRHGIASDVEVIAIQRIDEAFERLLKSDVKYRFSIDMASLKAE
jgi:D-arabinose 1-dehydrogenase-like Zn-dependent alcohol dehydrogenase